ncbi:helical backbone metal receptor [Roseateles sp. GG27B]
MSNLAVPALLDLPERLELSELRIASLVPSITELLVALGLRPFLVARTGYCIHPAEAVRDVPKVGGTKDVNLASCAAWHRRM